ncbi:MAG: hypothetical protein ACT4OG_01430 [Alphaproteobacteria bacterium]
MKTTSGQYRNKNKALTPYKNRGGAPLGNRNALKHGRYRKEMRALGAMARERIQAARAAIAAAESLLGRAPPN